MTFRTFMLPAFVSVLLASPVSSAPPGQRVVNFSSHPAAFFESFLPGRVFVYQVPGHSRAGGLVQGHHYGRDGKASLCVTTGDKNWAGDDPGPIYETRIRKQRIVSRSHARIYTWTSPESERHSRISPFYDPATGRFHLEIWSRKDRKLRAPWVGWIQDSWPRILADACPDLPLPGSLAINEKQTSGELEELRSQDPDAPIRNFPGSELRVPGAVGQAITDGKKTLKREELAAFMRANHGKILLNYRGKRRVLVIRDDKEELWKIDDAGTVTNVGHFDSDGFTIGIAWEQGAPVEWRYTIGFALPYAPTGERFAAFRLGDWLATQPSVTLPFFGRDVAFRFSPSGAVEADRNDGSTIAGSWRWSRGNLELRFPGLGDVATYEWRALARNVGWSPATTAAVR